MTWTGGVAASDVVVTREVLVGVGGVVLAAFAAVAVVPARPPAPRVLIMAIACGLITTLLTDWRAAGVAVLVSAVTYGGVLADNTGPAALSWGFTPIFLFAGMLGVGSRMVRIAERTRPQEPPS